MSPARVDRERVRACALLALVYLAGVGAVQLRPPDGTVATWWPAAGFAGALLILGDPRRRAQYAAGVAAASALANLSGGHSLDLAILLGLANAAEALVVAVTLPHRGRGWHVRSPEDFFWLVRSCVLGASTMGVAAGFAVWLTGGDAFEAVRAVLPSHLAAMLVILPLMLMRPTLTRSGPRIAELTAQAILLLACVVFVFWPTQVLALVFLPLPLLIWSALRFGPYVAAAEIFTLAVTSTWLTARGGGPFAVGGRSAAVDQMLAGAQVQIFLISAALMTLTSALAAAQRSELLRRLTAEEELSSRTLEATAVIIMVTDRHGQLLRTNPATTRVTGFAEKELCGRPIWEVGLIPPERVSLVRQMFDDPDGSSVPGSREADICTSLGDRRRVVWNNNIVRDELGVVKHVVFTGSDVTRERTTSGMLRHLLEAPMDTTLVGLDPTGRITVFNRGAEQAAGPDHR